MQEKIITSVDFGSSKISASLAIIHDDDCEILGSESVQSDGILKGAIKDESKCLRAFSDAVNKIKRKTNKVVSDVYVGINLKDIRISEMAEKVEVKNDKVEKYDIKKVLSKVKESTLLGNDEEIVDVIINFYRLDGKVSTENVIGWIGNELEIDCAVLVGKYEQLSKYKAVVRKAGYKFAGFYVNQIAAKNIFLRENNSIGTKALVDIGNETTNIAVFNNGEIKAVSFRPLGGNNITKDLSICGEVSLMQAEQIKCINSKCYESIYKDNSQGDEINIGTYKFSKELYYEVTKARIEELLKFVKLDLKNTSFYEGLCSIIIYGDGIIYFENVKDIAKNQINRKCTIATNKYLGMKKTSNITSLAGIEEVFNKINLLDEVSTSFDIEPNKEKDNEEIEKNISFDFNENEYTGSEDVSSRRILREKDKDENLSLIQKVKRMLEDIF
ncbi:MAG: cell division FtsA domain-containing protein [Clostridiales bacterium]|nr:cell division FtsA domain-containing protein [Clostridiales bacterium]